MKKFNQTGFTGLEIILIIVIVGVLCGITGYVISKQSQKTDRDTASSNSQTQKEEPKSAQVEAIPEMIDYGMSGVEILQKSDVSKLTQASNEFKTFISGMVGEKPEYEDICNQPNK